MKNADSRLARLEQSLRPEPRWDYRGSPAFLAMSNHDQQALQAFADKYTAAGHLRDFTDEDLVEFERLLIPIAQEDENAREF